MPSTESEVRDSYDGLAEDYDRRWSTYIEASIEETLDRMPVEPGLRLLDVGCGTGILLQRILDDYPGIDAVGVDLSPRMLEVADDRLGGRAELVEAGATELPFDTGSFDLVVSTSAFHYISRPDRALAEIRRVLDRRATFVLTDWCTDFVTTRLMTLLISWIDSAHHRAYDVDELVERLRRAGFDDIESDRYKIQWHWGLMTLVSRAGRRPADSNGESTESTYDVF